MATLPPSISFWTGAGTFSQAFITGALGMMNAIYDFGTIDTGSSGSTVFFWIFNNASGSINVADAICCVAGQGYNDTNALGLGEHASGSADHATTGTNWWDMQSGSLTGSVWVSSSFYFRGNLGFSGSISSSGSGISTSYMNPMSGSAAAGSRRLSGSGTILVLSGSSDGATGKSGSGWLIATYIQVLNGTPQGTRTGSFCLRYKYT